jgi:hypothetical protein
VDEIREEEIGGTFNMNDGDEKLMQNFSRKLQENKPLGGRNS